jgi:hypothetical protein
MIMMNHCTRCQKPLRLIDGTWWVSGDDSTTCPDGTDHPAPAPRTVAHPAVYVVKGIDTDAAEALDYANEDGLAGVLRRDH